MNYRRLGKTDLMVSEIGFGAEWMERRTPEECKAIIDRCEEFGINILDCWMSNPTVRASIGAALRGRRERWYIQGHIGSTWQNGQYVVSRDMEWVRKGFEDLLTLLETDYIDLGMIHFVDKEEEFRQIVEGEFLQYVLELKEQGRIHHIGLSTHNPNVARMAAEGGVVEMILFSVNPAFDMLPASEDIMTLFAEKYDENLGGINKDRAELYQICEQQDVGITVMKGYAGGRLFKAEASPFGVALTPVQCLHYALTRPAVASVMAGFDVPDHVNDAVAYESSSDEEKDYASILAGAPKHAYMGQCTYCGHCKPCPMEIDIALVNKYYDLAVMQESVPDSLRQHYDALEVKADACIACGACEERCPFGVKVAERMGKAMDLFN